MENKLIRDAAHNASVRLWMIAEALGIAEATFSRKLRRELPREDTARILNIIERLTKGGE